MFLFLICLLEREVYADIPTPGPKYAKEELGAPRLPPYISPDWVWMTPVGVFGALFVAMLLFRKPQNTEETAD